MAISFTLTSACLASLSTTLTLNKQKVRNLHSRYFREHWDNSVRLRERETCVSSWPVSASCKHSAGRCWIWRTKIHLNFHTSLTDCPSLDLLQAIRLRELTVREQLWLDSVFNSALSCHLISVNNDAQGEYLRRPYEASSKIAQFGGGVQWA